MRHQILKSRKDLNMTKANIKTKQGFTIIEVVLVLAIAGLIFLMVFIALPALQRSQRDTQRRDDMARFASQLSQYQANNNGDVPAADTTSWEKFVKSYLRVDKSVTTTNEQGQQATTGSAEDSFVDPSGANYNVNSVLKCTNDTDCVQKSENDDYKNGNIHVYTNATCDGENPKYIKGDRKIAFTYKLEGAGIYCGHN